MSPVKRTVRIPGIEIDRSLLAFGRYDWNPAIIALDEGTAVSRTSAEAQDASAFLVTLRIGETVSNSSSN